MWLFDLFVDNFDVRIKELWRDLVSHGFLFRLFYSLHVKDNKDFSILAIFPLKLLFFNFLGFLLFFCELLKSELLEVLTLAFLFLLQFLK